MITIDDWLSFFKRQPDVTIHSSGYVEGACDLLSGERFHYAKIGLNFSPSNQLLFEMSLPEEVENRCKNEPWIDFICYGVLDIMLLGPITPINAFNCTIKYIDFHEKRSSNLAFRLAARTATTNFLAQQTFNGLWNGRRPTGSL